MEKNCHGRTHLEETVGEYLRVVRKRKGFSQQRLAAESGLPAPYISQIERGLAGQPPSGAILSLCRALGIPARSVLTLAHGGAPGASRGGGPAGCPMAAGRRPQDRNLSKEKQGLFAEGAMWSRSARISDLQPGDHACGMYKTEEEQRNLVAPFIRLGLERNERVMCFTDAHTADEILDYLRRDGVSVESCLATRQLGIFDASDLYTLGDAFDPDRTAKLLHAEIKVSVEAGYQALRVTSEMTWALRGLAGSDRLLEYESKVGAFPAGTPCVAMCQYDRRRFDPSLLLDIALVHPIIVSGNNHLS